MASAREDIRLDDLATDSTTTRVTAAVIQTGVPTDKLATNGVTGAPATGAPTANAPTTPPTAGTLPYTTKGDYEDCTWKYAGYPQFSRWVASDQAWFITRRFSTLNARTILLLQSKIVNLENKLNDLDRLFSRPKEQMDDEDETHNGSFRLDGSPRAKLLDDLVTALSQYNSFVNDYSQLASRPAVRNDDVKAVRDWLANHEYAIDDPEAAYIDKDHYDDLIPVHPKQRSWFRTVLEKTSVLRRRPLKWYLSREPCDPLIKKKDGDQTVWHNDQRVESFSGLVIGILGLGMLIGPIWALYEVEPSDQRLIIITVFIVVFYFLVVIATTAKLFESLAAVAAYSAAVNAMHFDHLAEERQDRNFQVWLLALLQREPEQLAMRLAKKHREGKTTTTNVIVRFAALGQSVFRQEKVDNEVTVLQYLRRHTQVPVPEVYGAGTCWAGPYIVIAFVEGDLLSNVLKDPLKSDGRPVLNPRISDRALRIAYREMASLVLELSKPQFPRIGALEQQSDDFVVGRRPLTFNINELVTSANLTPTDLALTDALSPTFESSVDYFSALAEHHLSNLRKQRNDAVTDEADCQKNFIARCLFRKLVRDISTEHRHGPFLLHCDDFRPSNVLVDVKRFCINVVIDLEFAYVAPAELTYVAPWWLMLQSPEDWDSETDLYGFLTRYKPRIHLFLDALQSCEDEKVADGTLLNSQRLAARMEASMESGLFWVCLAARYSSMFDDIYWNFLDEIYYGPFKSIEDRIRLLDEQERTELGEIFQVKMEQAKDGTLDENYSTDALVDL
ncbi:hypothetical protein V492_06736 [Pseudogymnoascus sp. VKM F-4246]|nr:hypothetical protein V492_06736 [Pseudogymnoascus sp. VKM F-4246]